MGIYPTIANTISWATHNFEPSYKRGVAVGIFIGWGNLQGIMSSNIYLQRDAPAYRIGHGVVLGYLLIFLLGGSALRMSEISLVLRFCCGSWGAPLFKPKACPQLSAPPHP